MRFNGVLVSYILLNFTIGYNRLGDDGYGFYDLEFDFKDDPLVLLSDSIASDERSIVSQEKEAEKPKEDRKDTFSNITPVPRVRSVTLDSEELNKSTANSNFEKLGGKTGINSEYFHVSSRSRISARNIEVF